MKQQLLNKEALNITEAIQTITRGSGIATLDDISSHFGIAKTAFAPSATTYKSRALKAMLSESLIAKRKHGKTTYYSLLQPQEDIEAFFIHSKQNKKVDPKPSYVRMKNPKTQATEATISLADVTITIKLK